jgi:hypothetical protein
LTPKHIRHQTCLDLLSASQSSHNQWHGNLLVVLAVLNLGIDIDAQQTEHFVKTLQAWDHGVQVPPLIMSTITAIIGQCHVQLNDMVLGKENMHTDTPGYSRQPGLSLWQNASARLDAKTKSSNRQTSIAALHQALLPGGSPDERIEVLQDTTAIREVDEGSSDLYRRLRTLYDVTGHVPLKEAILPALAARAVSDEGTVFHSESGD